ncbi:MAG: hypothetical protein WAN65_05430 [Candidatus Sulfotelmatobacter sp.]
MQKFTEEDLLSVADILRKSALDIYDGTVLAREVAKDILNDVAVRHGNPAFSPEQNPYRLSVPVSVMRRIMRTG